MNAPTLPPTHSPADAPPAYAPPPAMPHAPLSTPFVVKSAQAVRQPRRWPVVLLFVALAALIPETIATSSTSVAKIIYDPFSLLFIIIFYGTADIIIREAIVRRPLGLAAKILLGVAFGFVNEGVVAGTWYTVQPTGDTFILGVDVGWAVALTVFHVFISVLVPIYLIDSLVPSVAGAPLLRKRGIIICGVVFVAFSSLVVFNPQFRVQRAIVFAVALGLAAIALRLAPARPAPPAADAKRAPGMWRLRAMGFLAQVLFFICAFLLPALFAYFAQRARLNPVLPGLVASAILVGLTAWAVALGDTWSKRKGWSPRRQLALMTGVFAFPLLLSLIPSLAAVWEPVATAPFMLVLIVLSWRAWRADRRGAKAAREAGSPVTAQAPVTPALP